MALPTASDNVFPKVILSEGAAPATPASGQVKLYAKADGLLYSKDDLGAETLVSGGAGGGGGGVSRLGKTAQGASTETMTVGRIYAKKVTLPSAGTILSVAGIVKAPGTGLILRILAAVYENNAGVVGQLRGMSADQPHYLQTDGAGTIPAHTLYRPVGAHFTSAQDVWIALQSPTGNSNDAIYYDTGGSDRYFDASYVATGGTVFAQTNSTRDYSIHAIFLPD